MRRLYAVRFRVLWGMLWGASCVCSCNSSADSVKSAGLQSAVAPPPQAQAEATPQVDLAAQSGPVEQRADREVLYRPRGIEAGRALPTVIWLHGFRANPDLGRIGQALSDQLGIAILGVSATEPLGEDRYRWSEVPKRDSDRIRAGISKQGPNLVIQGKPALFGFSQGGKMAAEIAAREPDRYAGAWAIAPGGFAPPQFHAEGKLDGMFFRCSIGAGDPRGKVEWARSYCEQASAAGAETETDIEVGFDRHAFPPDFRDTFVAWATRTLRPSSP